MTDPEIKPDLVLGIGNILLRDEGIGVRAIEAMRAQQWPDSVDIVDGGTSGADLVEIVANRRRLIVIDSVQAQAKPGTVFEFTLDELAASRGDSISIHEFGLMETLTMARHLGVLPQEVVIYGVQPKEVSPGLELSEEIAAVIPRLIELVRKRLAEPAQRS